ncbi:uncharacterized protein [Linepithema humile]|uniref:uncharacterized protein n=1 Tax=Linepithema humile TaxID=83485 RepID=UPI00351DEFFC
MYAPNPHRMCRVTQSTEQEQAKLQKIKELTSILKDTDKNLTICEEILTAYMKKRLKEKKEEMQRRNKLESRITEIMEKLETRLLVE